MLPKLLAPETVAERPDIVRRVREMIVGTEPEGAASVLRGMAVRKDNTSFLSRIIAPTLILCWEQRRAHPGGRFRTHASRDRRLAAADHGRRWSCFQS